MVKYFEYNKKKHFKYFRFKFKNRRVIYNALSKNIESLLYCFK